jgi:hypothetical protein
VDLRFMLLPSTQWRRPDSPGALGEPFSFALTTLGKGCGMTPIAESFRPSS